uniref:Putative product n=1 Tax=Xenopsylla cheopis TaxID=163159 RepID=A0A6M2E155_XENCH
MFFTCCFVFSVVKTFYYFRFFGLFPACVLPLSAEVTSWFVIFGYLCDAYSFRLLYFSIFVIGHRKNSL